MHEPVLKQERLNNSAPANYNTRYKVRRVLNYQIDSATGRLAFSCDRDVDDDLSLPVRELNLDVVDDTEFYIRLSDDKDWYWSKGFDAITTKLDKKRFYGKILYERNGKFVSWDGSSSKTWACKRIMFLAALNEDTTVEPSHGFSLNIDLILPGGGILPISLDPDIQNPKPAVPDPIPIPIPGLLSAR